MPYFTHTIYDWTSWGAVFQSMEAFTPLIQAIYAKEGLPFVPLQRLTPGTNAVFAVGDTIAKVYAPRASGQDMTADYHAERFGLKRAGELGLPAPRLLAAGHFQDAYDFYYLVLSRESGQAWGDVRDGWGPAERTRWARQVRAVTDRLDAPTPPFRDSDALMRALACPRWAPYTATFQEERQTYLRQRGLPNPVYVHGDLTCENLLVRSDSLVVLDFADACLAPRAYEWAVLVCDLFDFDPDFLRGYFGPRPLEVAEALLHGLLLHDFGGGLIAGALGQPADFPTLSHLRTRIRTLLARASL